MLLFYTNPSLGVGFICRIGYIRGLRMKYAKPLALGKVASIQVVVGSLTHAEYYEHSKQESIQNLHVLYID